MFKKKRIAVIGAGTMGGTIVQGLLRSKKVGPRQLVATARTVSAAQKFSSENKISCTTKNFEAAKSADILILCVKPKDIPQVTQNLKETGAIAHQPLIISIVAGISTAYLATNLGDEMPIIRAMPNTPCLLGKGMTVVSRGKNVTDIQINYAKDIFLTLGRCLELEETHLDAVTGLSASGPAFVYIIIEAFADGGVKCGLPRKVATELAAQMTLGAAEMVLATARHPAALKDDVTTPAGCTIAGIFALEDGKIRSVLAKGVEVAAQTAANLQKK